MSIRVASQRDDFGGLTRFKSAVAAGLMGLDAYTKAMLHFNDSLTDEAGNVTMSNNSATFSYVVGVFENAISFSSGSTSISGALLAFLATLTHQSVFTLEARVKASASAGFTSNGSIALLSSGASTSGAQIWFGIIPDGRIRLWAYESGKWDITGDTSTLLDGNFHHIALVFSGNSTVKGYVDGAEKLSASLSSFSQSVTGTFYIGNWGNLTTGAVVFDEYRISNTARWSSVFTPPAAQY